MSDLGQQPGAIVDGVDAIERRLDRRDARLVDRRFVHARGVEIAELLRGASRRRGGGGLSVFFENRVQHRLRSCEALPPWNRHQDAHCLQLSDAPERDSLHSRIVSNRCRAPSDRCSVREPTEHEPGGCLHVRAARLQRRPSWLDLGCGRRD